MVNWSPSNSYGKLPAICSTILLLFNVVAPVDHLLVSTNSVEYCRQVVHDVLIVFQTVSHCCPFCNGYAGNPLQLLKQKIAIVSRGTVRLKFRSI